MSGTTAFEPEPPPIPRNACGMVVGSEAARRLARIRVERCKQTGERYRTRADSRLYAGPYAAKKLRKLLRNIIQEILSTPVEVGDGQTIDLVDELRRKVAKVLTECEDPETIRDYLQIMARYTVAPPKAEENAKVVGNPDLDIALTPGEQQEIEQRARAN